MTIEQDKLNAVFLSALMVLSVMVGSIALAGSAAAVASGVTLQSTTAAPGTSVAVNATDSSTAPNGDVYVIIDENGNGDFNTGEEMISAPEVNGTQEVGSLDTSGLADGNYSVYAVESGTTPTNGTALGTVSDKLTIDDGNVPSVTSAVEYNNGDIEVAFSEDIQPQSGNFDVTVDGDSKTASVGSADGSNGRLVLTGLDDVTPNQELTINFGSLQDAAGNSFNPGGVSVQVTSTTFNNTADHTGSDGAYEGSTVAYVAQNANTDILVEKSSDGSTWSHVFSGSTDTNNQVFVFDTEGEDAGVDYRITEGSGASTDSGSFALRPFSLSADAPSTAVKEDSFSVDVNANSGDREISVNLLDSSGSSVDAVDPNPTLGGSGDGSFNLASTETGNYTVEVVDVGTGVTATTDTIAIEEAGETVVNFGGTSNNNERGDVIEIPLSLQNTQSGHVKIGSESAHFRVYGNITDGNNDGKVTLLLNTYNGSAENDYGVTVKNSDDDFTVDKSDNVPENIEVVKPLDTGTYDLEAGLENVENSATGLSTFTVGTRSTDSATTFIGSSSTDFEGQQTIPSLTQSEAVALQDKVIVSVEASGIYGLLQEYQNEDGSYTLTADSEENLSLEVTQTNPGRNSDGAIIPEEEIEVVPDAENDTLFFVMDTNSIEEFDVAQDADPEFNVTFTVGNPDGNALIDEEQSVSTAFTVTERTATINKNAEDVVEVSAASDATISGTSSLAPGSSVSVEIRFDNNEFIQTNQATVGEDGEWSTKYDLSDTEVGNTFQVQVRGLSDQLDGEVVDSVSTTTEPGTTETVTSTDPTTTSTATPDTTDTTEDTTTEDTSGEDDSSDGGVPGFGLSAALIALIGAALIALRRD